MSQTTKLVRPALAVASQVDSVWHLARLEEALPSGGSAYADIYELVDGSLSLTGDRVRSHAYTVPGYLELAAGSTVRIEWHGTMERWFVTGAYV